MARILPSIQCERQFGGGFESFLCGHGLPFAVFLGFDLGKIVEFANRLVHSSIIKSDFKSIKLGVRDH
jgi:hypothetical protein